MADLMSLGGAANSVLQRVDDLLKALGCVAYVKTIYIGYKVGGQMVAAVYPHPGRVEIALALPEDHPSALLKDGTHLTWRSLPVSLDLRSDEDLERANGLVREAYDRVATGRHTTELPIDRFKSRARRGAFGSPLDRPGGSPTKPSSA
jgi:hypothetical protein